MALIKRESLGAVVGLRSEEVEVAALGGSVAVVELDLASRLAVESLASKLDRDDPASVYVTVPYVLAACVRDAGGLPLMGLGAWQAWGARNREVVLDLFNKAMALSGFEPKAAAKN